jgi:hypothetical protein
MALNIKLVDLCGKYNGYFVGVWVSHAGYADTGI